MSLDERAERVADIVADALERDLPRARNLDSRRYLETATGSSGSWA